jgi:predicted lipase
MAREGGLMKDKDLALLLDAPHSAWSTAGDDTQYRIVDVGDCVVVVFRGSDSRRDWMHNLDFPKRPYRDMPVPFHVHRGFLRAWKQVNDLITGMLEHVEKPIIVTGHSHGGALAILCMEDLWYRYPDKRGKLRLVTFGAPRVVGWYNWRKVSERWDGSVLYCNRVDVVTNLPFFLMGFLHVRRRVMLRGPRPCRMVDNHMIMRYAESMEGDTHADLG